ncbi:MAG: hypothetical protein ACOCV8_04360, partial [Spirochaetota bacterium]
MYNILKKLKFLFLFSIIILIFSFIISCTPEEQTGPAADDGTDTDGDGITDKEEKEGWDILVELTGGGWNT